MAAKLDVAFYPHIFDQILVSCDDDSLLHDACGRAWGRPEAYSNRGDVSRSSWGSPDVLDILHWTEGLFPDPGERNAAKAKVKAEAIEKEGPAEENVQREPRFILNFTYLLNEFPRISVRRTAEDGPPDSQFKLCVIVFTPGGEEEDNRVRANEKSWEEWKREMEEQDAEARRNAELDDPAMAALVAEEAEWTTTDGETDEGTDEDDEDEESEADEEVSQGSLEPTIVDEEVATFHADLDLIDHPPPPEPVAAPGAQPVPSETTTGTTRRDLPPAPLPPVPPGKERIKLTSMRAFWGLLRFFDAYPMGPCEEHGLQGDWHEMERCSRIPSLLSYIIVGTERWVFDLTNVTDDVPSNEGVEFDTAAWIADVDALRAERPDTPDFQLKVEAGLARWYEPSQAEVYNDVLDHIFYESGTGFRNRYRG